MTDNPTITCTLCHRPHPLQQTETIVYVWCGGLAIVIAKKEEKTT